MANPSKQKGTAWESACVELFRSLGLDHVERRALRGNKDCGDLAGVYGWTIECKNEKTITLADYMDEAKAEACNADPGIVALGGVPTHVVLVKRRNRPTADGYAVMPIGQFVHLLAADKWYEERRQASLANPE